MERGPGAVFLHPGVALLVDRQPAVPAHVRLPAQPQRDQPGTRMALAPPVIIIVIIIIIIIIIIIMIMIMIIVVNIIPIVIIVIVIMLVTYSLMC